jgi:hypothetical protein
MPDVLERLHDRPPDNLRLMSISPASRAVLISALHR